MIEGNAGTTLLDAARLTAEFPAPYPTPQAHDHACPKTPEQISEMRSRAPKRTSGGPPGISNLNEVVMTMVPAPYPTPNVSCGTRGGHVAHMDGRRSNLIDTVKLMESGPTPSPWASPAAHEAGGTPERFIERKELARENGSKLGISLTSLSLQAQLTTRTSSDPATGSKSDKRFFHVDDGGASYFLVAGDLEHAKQLLRDSGVEFTAEDGFSYPIDAPEVAEVEWREISAQDAAKKGVCLGLDGAGPRSVLAACDIGDWFTSEI